MALRDDKAARAFGKVMIRDMIRSDALRYAGWIMDVAKGARPVCSIPFKAILRNKSRDPRRIPPAFNARSAPAS
jgi:hypothetical protein